MPDYGIVGGAREQKPLIVVGGTFDRAARAGGFN